MLVLSLGGSNNMTSMPLGSFFLGSSVVSLSITPWIFPRWGRKRGFCTGIGLGLVGTALGVLSVPLSSPGLYMVSTFFFGMATGIGFAMRFAAVEVVPVHWASRAVTLVVSGGVLAAFAGPESAGATRDSFGDDLTYLGMFFMTGVFNVGNLVATLLVQFPDGGGASASDKQDNAATLSLQELSKMVASRHFIVPMLCAVVGWAAMGMPMSLVRIVMAQVGYRSRDSLTVIELHFLGMYAPGFFTGNLIKRFGYKAICALSVVVFAVAEVILFLPDEDEDESILLWAFGLILVGMAWNFVFTASTVWLLQKSSPGHKASLQAANDCLMFLLAGIWLFASSYIFEAGGSGIEGWETLNWVVNGLVAFMAVLLLGDYLVDRMQK